MRFFTKHETIGVIIIFLIVGAFTFQGLLVSIRRSRDAQRMADLGAIANALDQFHEEYGFFPPSDNGKIKACKGDNFDEVLEKLESNAKFDNELFLSGLQACEWGQDSLQDIFDTTRTPYIKPLPQDPQTSQGLSYHYLSNTRRYQIFAHLEGGKEEDFFNQAVEMRALNCGTSICNVGRSYIDTPLDRTIEQYEIELLEKARKK